LQEFKGKQYPVVQMFMIEVLGQKPEDNPVQNQFNSYQPQQPQPQVQQPNNQYNRETFVPNNIENISNVVVSDEDLPF
jgi:hypothetical protein